MCRKLRFSQKIIRSQPIPIEKMSRSKRVKQIFHFLSGNYYYYLVIQSVTFNALHVNLNVSDTVANPDGRYSAEIRQHVGSSVVASNELARWVRYSTFGILYHKRGEIEYLY